MLFHSEKSHHPQKKKAVCVNSTFHEKQNKFQKNAQTEITTTTTKNQVRRSFLVKMISLKQTFSKGPNKLPVVDNIYGLMRKK